MESEKVKEIKKALEQNDDNGIMYEIDYKKRTCKFMHHEAILTLINELESENERLKTQLAQANAGIVNCSGCKLVELNAVREFAERLKDKVKNFCGTEEENHYYDVSKEGACEEIDETLKEYEKWHDMKVII